MPTTKTTKPQHKLPVGFDPRKALNRPPESPEAEMGVLASILHDEVCIIDCERAITPDYFYSAPRRTIYTELLAMSRHDVRIDLITFTNWLRDRDLLNKVGGAGAITDIQTYIMTAANIEYYLGIMVEMYKRRELITIGTEQVYHAYAIGEDNTNQLIDEAQSKLIALATKRTLKERDIREIASTTYEQIANACDHPGQVPGLTTGLGALDKASGGLQPQHLIVVCGKTSDGKTALAFGMALRLTVGLGIPCAYVSLEMSAEELVQRGVGTLADLNMHEVMTEGASAEDVQKITKAISDIQSAPLIIRDLFDVTVAEIRAIARQLKHQHDIKLLVIDYLQLIRQTDPERREAEISGAALSFKGAAKELGIPVIVLSQLNEEGKLSYARAIGHHADKVIRIVREEKYPVLVMDKNRGGPREVKIPVWFDPTRARFTARQKGNGDEE